MNIERSALVGVALLAVAVLAAGGVAGQGDPVTLTVSVVDQDGDPVGGATIEATWETESGETENVTGTTANNGKVFLDVDEGATVDIDIEDDTYVRNRPLTVENVTESDVELPVTRSGITTVSVVDASNRSQADARVTIRDAEGVVDRGRTDDDGVYESARLERGEYNVTVVKPGYFESARDVTVRRNTEATVRIERGTVTLDLRVLDDHFDPPVVIQEGSVRVESSVYDAEVTVTEGTASLNVPVNVDYTAEVIKDGYDSTPRTIRVRESSRSANVTAQRTPTLSVMPANERVLVGETTRVTVRNAYDEPVAGVTVEVEGEAVGETDDRGEMDVPIDEVGTQEIVATDGSVSSDPVTVEGVETSEETDDSANESEDESGSTNEGVPGFGVVAAVVALLAGAGAAVRRRDR